MKSVSRVLCKQVNQRAKLEGIEKIKLEYGMKVLVNNLSKLAIIALISIILKIHLQVLIIFITYANPKEEMELQWRTPCKLHEAR